MNNIEVTKEQVHMFENIRQSGLINMLDWASGSGLCRAGGVEIDKGEWRYILKNYEGLISHYGVPRGG